MKQRSLWRGSSDDWVLRCARPRIRGFGSPTTAAALAGETTRDVRLHARRIKEIKRRAGRDLEEECRETEYALYKVMIGSKEIAAGTC